jgi:hypothetical protein
MVSALKLVDPAASSLHFLPSGSLLRVCNLMESRAQQAWISRPEQEQCICPSSETADSSFCPAGRGAHLARAPDPKPTTKYPGDWPRRRPYFPPNLRTSHGRNRDKSSPSAGVPPAAMKSVRDSSATLHMDTSVRAGPFDRDYPINWVDTTSTKMFVSSTCVP